MPKIALSDPIQEIYDRLRRAYGPQHWWPGEGSFEVIVGAILTQSTAWTNVEKALDSMRANCCWSFDDINSIPEAQLASIVRPSGYYNAKARKLKEFAAHIKENYDGDLDAFLAMETTVLRKELLSIRGIGYETADDIIVYAAGKLSFVIDSYTRRIIDRMGLTPQVTPAQYGDYQSLFHANLPTNTSLYNEYHALLDRHAKYSCVKRNPRCESCCLANVCATGLKVLNGRI